MARPKKPRDESRGLIIRVRVNQAEKDKILMTAKEAGFNVSDWIRHKTADVKPRLKMPVPEMEILHKLLAIFGRNCSLLNQIARSLNRKQDSDQFDIPLTSISYATDELRKLMAVLREKISHAYKG